MFRFIYVYIKYHIHRLIVLIYPKFEIARCYKKVFGRKPNLKTPRSLIEKIYWMQMYSDTSKWTLLADKFRMREYVKECGLERYLPKVYDVWSNPDDINFTNLPNKFVVKSNNSCGEVIIIEDKSNVSINDVILKAKRWLRFPFGYSGCELHYTKIEPCIFAEEYLLQEDLYNNISPNSMVDFKFWCFNGHVESCLVTYDRSKENLFIDLYDSQWNRQLEHLREFKKEKIARKVEIPCPDCIEEMKHIASILSKGFPEMRVDLYVVNNKPVIGELTMSTGYGYFTSEYYDYLGKLTDLSIVKKIK